MTGVDSAFFRLFGVTAVVGRVFEPSDALLPSVQNWNSTLPLPVLISTDLATRLGRTSPLGTTELAGRRVEVIGVLPQWAKFPGETNVWAPVTSSRECPARYVRLEDGTAIEELAAQFSELQFTPLRDAVRRTPDYAVVCRLLATLALVLLAWIQMASMVAVDGGRDERDVATVATCLILFSRGCAFVPVRYAASIDPGMLLKRA